MAQLLWMLFHKETHYEQKELYNLSLRRGLLKWQSQHTLIHVQQKYPPPA